MASENNGPEVRVNRTTAAIIVALIIVGTVVALLIGHGVGPLKHVPAGLKGPIRAVLVLAVGGGISVMLERRLFAARAMGKTPFHRRASLRFGVRLLLYLSIFLAVLAAFGVGLSSVVFGGAFLTVVIGMAGQTLFGNLLAGVGIVFFHPFQIGDKISLLTEQYPVTTSTFPHETGRPGYRGVVVDINLMYTQLWTEDGVPMMVPNGIILQAAIENVSRMESVQVRLRFDVDMVVPADRFISRAEETLNDIAGGEAIRVEVVDIGIASYGVVVQMQVPPEADGETIRHQISLRLLPIILELKQRVLSVE